MRINALVENELQHLTRLLEAKNLLIREQNDEIKRLREKLACIHTVDVKK